VSSILQVDLKFEEETFLRQG